MAQRRLTNEFVALIIKIEKIAGTYSIGIHNSRTGITEQILDDLDEYETWFDFARRLFCRMNRIGKEDELAIMSVARV